MEYLEFDREDILRFLPDRDPCAHKGNFGKILLLCGSMGCTGAPALAAMGALRSGAGLVYLGVPKSIYNIEAVKLTEPLVFPVPDEKGMFSNWASNEICKHLNGMNAALVGPGMGMSEGTFNTMNLVLHQFRGPVVLDADGLNQLSLHRDMLRGRMFPTVLTPHEGEFIRLGGQLQMGRVEAAAQMARDIQALVVLKGHNTVITDGYSVYVNQTGNPGMAVGGSGDMLAGMLTSFLGQGLSPFRAAVAAVWLHGAAGDLCAKEIGQYGMLPSDMLNVLPRLMK